jgi:hypothetical protein
MELGITREVLSVWRERSELKRKRVPDSVSVGCQCYSLERNAIIKKERRGVVSHHVIRVATSYFFNFLSF